MPEFFQTQMGHQYYQGTLPENNRQMKRLAKAIEIQNKIALASMTEEQRKEVESK